MCRNSEGNLFRLIALGVTVAALAFQIISLVAPFWISVSQADDSKWNLGLWLNCTDWDCKALTVTPGWIRTTQAFTIMSLISGFGSLTGISIFTFRPTETTRKRKWPTILITLTPFIAAVLEQIAVGVFIREVFHGEPSPDAQGHLSWALCFGLVAVVLYSAACVFLFIDLVRFFYGHPVKMQKLSNI